MKAILSGIWKRITEQPVYAAGLVSAGVSLAVGFGLQWTGEQVSLVNAFTVALLAFIVQKKVTPV